MGDELDYYRATCEELWFVIDSIGERMDASYDPQHGFHKPEDLLRDIAEDISEWYCTQKHLDGLDGGGTLLLRQRG
jgi:hypothetical protein